MKRSCCRAEQPLQPRTESGREEGGEEGKRGRGEEGGREKDTKREREIEGERESFLCSWPDLQIPCLCASLVHQITLPWIPRHHFGVEGCTTSSYWVLTCLNKQQECTSLIVSLPMIILMCFVKYCLWRNSNKSTCKWSLILAMYLYAYTYVYTNIYIYIQYILSTNNIFLQPLLLLQWSCRTCLKVLFCSHLRFWPLLVSHVYRPIQFCASMHCLSQAGPPKHKPDKFFKGHRKTKWGTNKSSTRDWESKRSQSIQFFT